MRHVLAIVAAGFAVVALAGCGDSTPPPPPPPQVVQQPEPQVAPPPVDSGPPAPAPLTNIEMQLDTPVKTSLCFVALVPQSGGRPHVLQIRSYEDPTVETYPSFYFHAPVTHDKTKALSGQKVAGEVFFQEQPNAPVWQSPADKPAEITVTSASEEDLQAEFQVTLVNAETGVRKEVQGKLGGPVKQAESTATPTP